MLICMITVLPSSLSSGKKADARKIINKFRSKKHFNWEREVTDPGNELDEITLKVISSDLLKSQGAHKPTMFVCNKETQYVKDLGNDDDNDDDDDDWMD